MGDTSRQILGRTRGRFFSDLEKNGDLILFNAQRFAAPSHAVALSGARIFCAAHAHIAVEAMSFQLVWRIEIKRTGWSPVYIHSSSLFTKPLEAYLALAFSQLVKNGSPIEARMYWAPEASKLEEKSMHVLPFG